MPAHGVTSIGMRDLWSYRELLRNLALKNIKISSRRTALGLLWTVLNPLALIAIYFLAFRFVLGVEPVENYALFVSIGVLHWTYFTGMISSATTIAVQQSGLMENVAFPRFVIPLSLVASGLLQHLFGVVALAILFFPLGGIAWWGMWAYVPVLVLATTFCAGIAFAFAGLGVLFRDLAQLVPILLRVGFFVSPVLYRFDRLSPEWQRVLNLNPFASYLNSLRDVLYDNVYPAADAWLTMLAWAAGSLLVGGLLFRRLQDDLTEWL